MEPLSVIENKNETGVYYTVITEDGMPINYGHFADRVDADTCIDILIKGGFTISSDQSRNVCASMNSWISI